jgi:hypothetical protein
MSPVSELSALPNALTCTLLHVLLFMFDSAQLTTKHCTMLNSYLLVVGERRREEMTVKPLLSAAVI